MTKMSDTKNKSAGFKFEQSNLKIKMAELPFNCRIERAKSWPNLKN